MLGEAAVNRRAQRPGLEAHLNRPGEQGSHLLVHPQFRDLHLSLRELLMESRQAVRQERSGKYPDVADGQGAARDAARLACSLNGGRDFGEQTRRLAPQDTPCCGESHLPPVAFEKGCADLFFQVTHLSAQGGLRQMQALGGATKV